MEIIINTKENVDNTFELISPTKDVIDAIIQMEEALPAVTLGLKSLFGMFISLANERALLYKIVTGLMLDTGLYDYSINGKYIEELENYNLIIKASAENTTLSIENMKTVPREA